MTYNKKHPNVKTVRVLFILDVNAPSRRRGYAHFVAVFRHSSTANAYALRAEGIDDSLV